MRKMPKPITDAAAPAATSLSTIIPHPCNPTPVSATKDAREGGRPTSGCSVPLKATCNDGAEAACRPTYREDQSVGAIFGLALTYVSPSGKTGAKAVHAGPARMRRSVVASSEEFYMTLDQSHTNAFVFGRVSSIFAIGDCGREKVFAFRVVLQSKDCVGLRAMGR
ncbi:hypothetical protein BSY16_6147 (plasmid) [Sinorhizobium sp. RAC02]|nr:hypothetical protein BSY16_6147 [Sinorhizobium sp. RAC02]